MINKIPEILKNELNIKGDKYEYKLPKKYHKDILVTYNYSHCIAPKKYSGEILLEKNNKVDSIFLRYDKVKGYHLGDKIVYKGKLNRLVFKDPVLGIV